jgi:hypothetical protein
MKRLPLFSVVTASLACGGVWAADAHVHGVATLQIAIDRNELTLEFSTPLDNLVGFEHAPRNDKQKAAVQRMAERLRQAESLFVPSAQAQCSRHSLKLDSPVIDPALLSGTGSTSAYAKGVVKGKDSHASLTAEVVFRCRQPQHLSAVEVKAFDAFAGLKRVDVQVAGANKQAAAKLTPRARLVTW